MGNKCLSQMEDNGYHSAKHQIKLLFLDVDGVLNGEKVKCGYNDVDDFLLYLLKTIVDETDCYIVLSTTWRLYENTRFRLLEYLKTRADINVDDVIIGDTPAISQKKRVLEIQTFLESKSFKDKYEVVSWCAIDDMALNKYDPNHFMDGHFIRTNYRKGMTPHNASEVIRILNDVDTTKYSEY